MLEKEREINTKRFVAFVLMFMLAVSSVMVVHAKEISYGNFKATITGTYRDGVLAGTTKSNINSNAGSYNEVKLWRPSLGYFQTKRVYGNQSGHRSVSTSCRVGTGQMYLRVYHTAKKL